MHHPQPNQGRKPSTRDDAPKNSFFRFCLIYVKWEWIIPIGKINNLFFSYILNSKVKCFSFLEVLGIIKITWHMLIPFFFRSIREVVLLR